MNLCFWMVLNLGVPIIGPIFTLVLVAPAHGWRVAKTLIAGSVKDGQLFWCANGLCASAGYEVVTTLERGSGEVSLLVLCLAGLCVLGFICSSCVMLGLVNAHYGRLEARVRYRQGPSAAGSFSRAEIGMSIVLTGIAAVLFAFLHMHLNPLF
ncbi:hypothetical protein A6V36_27920 [Paraburkholderia ginsengiterrae]|uniref:Uncharacterized protein n=1 Tax=Paraburkholderia ginsengiterrae TaxID=1462993 RepID=A0A1A9MZQ2_9BURK|nr:hypothetical protein [Paraburkholderia ginsengiterrae]OAJ54086.1 hypothetical protein A6V37_35150 [Paraburkholderia ginsengiterrae]OAJ59174.1 hypothetical protein A6V36_27920 [Paraburkholderia ginsengiterrae]